MSSEDHFDEFLQQQLRESKAYVTDDGFTAGVLASLPALRVISRRSERLIIGIPLLIISALVFSQLPVPGLSASLWHAVSLISFVSLLKVGALVSAGMLLVCYGWIARQSNWL